MRHGPFYVRGRARHSAVELRVRVDRSRDYVELLGRHIPHRGGGKHEVRDAAQRQGAVKTIRGVVYSASSSMVPQCTDVFIRNLLAGYL